MILWPTETPKTRNLRPRRRQQNRLDDFCLFLIQLASVVNIKPSTAASAAGGTVATALVVIIDWILTLWHISMPAAVGAALATIFAALGAFLAPRSPPSPEQIADIQSGVYPPTTPL